MFILGLGLIAFGYALAYYAINILYHAYFGTAMMNPAPFTVLLGIPQGGGNGASSSGGQQQSANG